MKISKHDVMRNTNTLSVLESIREFGPITKRELQDKTGLSWGAISNITNDLLNRKVIIEYKSTDFFIGRTPSNLDINNQENLSIGIDINLSGLTAVLVDLKCRILKKINYSILNVDKDEILSQIKQIVQFMTSDPKIDKSKIIGIGVAMQGSVDTDKGISVFSHHFKNWNNVPIKNILENEFNIPVYMEHDPNCMMLAERWLGLAKSIQDIHNAVLVRLDMGIGMSIMINGEIYRGSTGNAGEFGHITMVDDGPRCGCGNQGCLEVYSSGEGLVKRFIESMKDSMSPKMDNVSVNSLTPSDISRAARSGDALAINIYKQMGKYLGIGLSNITNLFDPEIVILTGDMIEARDFFLPEIEAVMSQRTWKASRVNVKISKMGADAAAIGAAIVVLQRFLSDSFLISETVQKA